MEASDPEALRFEVSDFDALVATHNLSAHWAAQTESIRLGYYIQDYEPFFYPTGSKGQEKARQSYTLPAPYRHFCKTRWTAELLQHRHQLRATVIGPSVDSSAFAPGRWPSSPGPLLVAAMIRVSCERRQPQRTANVLNSLAKRYGNQLQLRCFGSTHAELATAGIQLRQEVQNLGRLNPSGVAQLLRQANVFIDVSTFQAMGLTAMEAMASGTCVIGPRVGGFVEVISGVKTQGAELGIAVDTNSTEAILESACELIDNHERRQALSEAAFGVTAYQPVISAAALLDCLFEDA